MSFPKGLVKVMGLRRGFGADTIPTEHFEYKPVPLKYLLESCKKEKVDMI